MGRLLPLFFLANLALMVIALIDCLSTDEVEIRALPKIFWALLILLFSPAGPIVWFIAGRPKRAASGPKGRRWAPGGGSPGSGRPRPVAPDDDPEFLRSLSEQRRDDEELLRMWEADLRRREEELRRREDDDDKPAAE